MANPVQPQMTRHCQAAVHLMTNLLPAAKAPCHPSLDMQNRAAKLPGQLYRWCSHTRASVLATQHIPTPCIHTAQQCAECYTPWVLWPAEVGFDPGSVQQSYTGNVLVNMRNSKNGKQNQHFYWGGGEVGRGEGTEYLWISCCSALKLIITQQIPERLKNVTKHSYDYLYYGKKICQNNYNARNITAIDYAMLSTSKVKFF